MKPYLEDRAKEAAKAARYKNDIATANVIEEMLYELKKADGELRKVREKPEQPS